MHRDELVGSVIRLDLVTLFQAHHRVRDDELRLKIKRLAIEEMAKYVEQQPPIPRVLTDVNLEKIIEFDSDFFLVAATAYEDYIERLSINKVTIDPYNVNLEGVTMYDCRTLASLQVFDILARVIVTGHEE